MNSGGGVDLTFRKKRPRLWLVALNFTVRRGVMFLKCCGRLISLVVDPGVLKRALCTHVVLEFEPDPTRWDTVRIGHYLRLLFPTHH